MNLHKSNIELYKMHLNENFTHYWSAESLSDKTINVLAAKEYLLHKGIIYEKGRNATKLNPLLFNITNFDDALLFIENQEKKLVSSNITQNFISENYGQVSGHQSSFSDFDQNFSTTIPQQTPQININNSQDEIKEKKWAKTFKYIGDNFVKLMTSIIAGIIVIIISIKLGLKK